MRASARPLERALFERDFEDAPADRALDALAAFRNDDGGFGRGLEPDLWLPASSVLCTTQALQVLEEIAAHWSAHLHGDVPKWPVAVLPRAEVLALLWRSAERVPRALLEDQTARLVADAATLEAAGADGVARCERFVREERAPRGARDGVARRMREEGTAIASRDPAEWSGYVAKPLKLAPDPSCVLAEPLRSDVERNLDWEIAQQEPGGSWKPSWSWGGAYPEAWAEARRWWRGDVTLQTLRSLRAYGRIEGVPPR